MENPEEVLQALDEFQKMRPTEIPRELEEYLCWVAKTGDPIYQWSLIKALFREKLTRVMTDFYESCPSLDLAPCPNVETFNYDTMKSNLLERLESFANAPFTVQRICELLTAPRKEYNRVDKFMRAIEKNILVVSTKEPGSTIRRNENGDGMVNGSVEDDTPGGESHDVEMDSWVKDCTTSTVGMPGQTMDVEARLLDDVTTTVPKTGPAANGGIQEKADHTTINTCESGLNFVPSTSEFTGPALETRDSISSGHGAQGLGTSVVHETPSIAREVPDANMNEDTSSQPSLDIDSPDTEHADPNRKLQTTFQAKDFITHEKSPEPYEKEITEKPDQESEVATVENSPESLEACEKLKQRPNERESVLPNMENFLHASTRLENSVITSDGTPTCEQKSEQTPEIGECSLDKDTKDIESENSTSLDQDQSSSSNSSEPLLFLEDSVTKDKIDDETSNFSCTTKEMENEDSMKTDDLPEAEQQKPIVDELNGSNEPVLNTEKETSEEIKQSEKSEIETEDSKLTEDTKLIEESKLTEDAKNTEDAKFTEDSKFTEECKFTEDSNSITVEEATSEKFDSTDSSQSSESNNLTIEETTEDDSSETKSLVPDSIPIIEEPKEIKPDEPYTEEGTTIEEIDSKTCEIESLPKNEPTINENLENNDTLSENEVTTKIPEETKTEVSIAEEKQIPEDVVPEAIVEKVTTRPQEAMEVDSEENAATVQGDDEPMDVESSKVASS